VRLGVLDVGSNTVHLLVVDAQRGGHPTPMTSEKDELRLAENLDASGAITRAGADALVRTVLKANASAAEAGCTDLLAFATSALRDARTSAEVLARVRDETGVALQVLPGEDEARYTFLAVRRWYGWSAGRLLVLDIGGGSLELAAGRDEHPAAAASLPLGAGRLTRDWFRSAPTSTSSWSPPRGGCAGSVRRSWPSARPRRSARWPGSPARPRPARARGPGAGSPTSGCASSGRSSRGCRRATWPSWRA
jgi:exopolyphosphatase/guanosine-5'-triphosphate,3'-diphosphate pyrophosphatase